MRTLIIAFVLAASTAAVATPSRLVMLQYGRLLDGADAPVDATVSLRFSFFAALTRSEGEVPLWSENYDVRVTGGIYSVEVGNIDGGKKELPPSVFDTSAPVFLEVAAGGLTLTPRLRIGAVAVAATAWRALSLSCTGCVQPEALAGLISNIAAGAVGTAQLHDGAVTADKIASAAVHNEALEGGITADKLAGGIGAEKLAGGITNAQLAGNIGADKFAGGLTNAQLAGGITADKLSGGITSAQLAGGITADKLAGGITDAQLASGIDAGKLTGTVADALLSANVALRNGSPTFTDTVTFANVGITGLATGTFSGNGSLLTGVPIVVASGGRLTGNGTAATPLAFSAGPLQLADTSATAAATPAGTLRWHNGKVEVCDGSNWTPIYTPPPTTLRLSYTGSDQPFVVPSGVSSVTVKMWGAGGGGGAPGGWSYGFAGGAGGYTSATIAVTAGETLTVVVGQGGAYQFPNGANPNYGGGGGYNVATDNRYGSSGGGRSAIRRGGSELVTAGGGGGGGSSRSNSPADGNAGGAGGGLVGQAGHQAWSDVAASGASQTAGGSGGTSSGTYVSDGGKPGAQFVGGAVGLNSYGGGGGGGWYGGGGGAYNEPNTMGGGGGGSGYVGGSGVTSGNAVAGSGTTPPAMTDTDYLSGVAIGAVPAGAGGNGLVIIKY